MILYKRYIFNKVLQAFAAISTILITLIWFSRAIPFMHFITENGIKISHFFYLFILILPWLLLFIVPISLFGAILMVYNRMLMNNELTILKNSGLKKFDICKPIILIMIICSIFCYIISFYLMPYANKELRISRSNFENNYANLSFNPKTFETLRNLTIYAKNRDQDNNLYGIFLHDERNVKYSITLTAKNGRVKLENNNALLYMEVGTVQKFNYDNQKTEILNFDNYVFNLTETKTTSNVLRWKPKERYISELLHPETNSDSMELDRYRAEFHQRIVNPLLSAVFSIIALAFILRGNFNRRGNVKNIIFATLAATTFLISTMACYNLISSSEKNIPLLYLNLIVFLGISLKMLNEKLLKN